MLPQFLARTLWCWKLFSTTLRCAEAVRNVHCGLGSTYLVGPLGHDRQRFLPSTSAVDLFGWALRQKNERGFRKSAIWSLDRSDRKVERLVLVDLIHHLEINLVSTGSISPCKDPAVFWRKDKAERSFGGEKNSIYQKVVVLASNCSQK